MQITGIKDSVKQAKESKYYRIYVNKETGLVWCNQVDHVGTYDSAYSNPDIILVTLGSGKQSQEGYNNLSMKKLLDLVKWKLQ